MPIIKGLVKSTGLADTRSQRTDVLESTGWQAGIGMKKKQPLARGFSSSRIHLAPSSRRTAQHTNFGQSDRQFARAVMAAAVDQNNFKGF